MEFLIVKFVFAMVIGLFVFVITQIIMMSIFGERIIELTLLVSGLLGVFAGHSFSNYLENKYNEDFTKELKTELNKKTLVCDHFVITEPKIDFDRHLIFDEERKLMFKFTDCKLVEMKFNYGKAFFKLEETDV